MGSVSFVTMGCAKNEVDSAHMSDRLLAAGYDVIDDPSCADVVIVNTCSFIQAATEESIDAILEVAGLDTVERGDTHIVVSGCMPARYADDLEAEFPEVSAFVPCAQEAGIVGIVDELLGIERDAFGYNGPVLAPSGASSVSAYVKISDGCDRFCSYCTIPFIRGRYHSFTEQEIAAEVDALVENGVREIVLIAQDTGRWGDDLEVPSTLAELISHLAERQPDTWFRVMYIQPEGVTDDLISAIANHDNICSYFDIPFQHCEQEILRAMNRSGNKDEFIALVDRIREAIPDATLRTTLIAGFPGETEDQFERLCDFVEEAGLDYVGVFPYSQEDGTRAARMEEQIDDDEKLARAQHVRDVADAVSGAVVASRVGSVLNVLVCGEEEDGQLFGRAQCQAPDVDGVTYVDEGEVGQIVRVLVEDALLYEMEGSVVHER